MDDNVSKLISEITPLYNTYIENRHTISGKDALILMWDIGDILAGYINELDIKPHRLYRLIYGKSEGSSNIIQRSYITREFMGRCYRIRRIFESNDHIESIFPNLRSFTLFREAMPFFDNPKYIMNSEDKEVLIKLLNSDEETKTIFQKIKVLQRRRIGKTNPRTQRLYELEEEKDVFIKSYNEIYKLIRLRDFQKAQDNLQDVSKESLENISSILGSLVSEEVIAPSFKVSEKEPEPFGSLVGVLRKLRREKGMIQRNRFRRLVSPERISRLANMVYALTSEQAYNNYR